MILTEKSSQGDYFEYRVIEEDGGYVLVYHTGFLGSKIGGQAACIKDDGDEYTVFLNGREKITLDYSEAMNMMALLLLTNRKDKVKYTLFSETEELN